jgi:hypothetical protein
VHETPFSIEVEARLFDFPLGVWWYVISCAALDWIDGEALDEKAAMQNRRLRERRGPLRYCCINVEFLDESNKSLNITQATHSPKANP